MSVCKLQWATPQIDKQVMYMARVSNVAGQDSEKIRLLYYCMEEGHVSPFDMANVCIEVTTWRDISRQILRHSSFKFQEFSQRYADVADLPDLGLRECRLQDTKNRQNSIELNGDNELAQEWNIVQQEVNEFCISMYQEALKRGIAKEVARTLLPEGLTTTRLYMSGTMRSWIFYLKQRLHPSTQKEHREVAQHCLTILRDVAPITMDAFFGEKHD